MIQRIQSVWLLMSAVAAFLTMKFSFFSGNMVKTNQPKIFTYLTATSNVFILVLTAALGATAFIAIFLYKNRKLQLRITMAAFAAAILNIVLYYFDTRNFAEGNYDLTAIITLAIPIFLIMAIRGIYKDQKLVKSLDRLR